MAGREREREREFHLLKAWRPGRGIAREGRGCAGAFSLTVWKKSFMVHFLQLEHRESFFCDPCLTLMA